jgi:hypothetical protein
MAQKSQEKFGADSAPSGPGALLGVPPDAVANKIIKEAAREMERAEGHVHPGSPAALAQAVAAHKDDPGAPEYEVAAKVGGGAGSPHSFPAHTPHPGFWPSQRGAPPPCPPDAAQLDDLTLPPQPTRLCRSASG